MSKGRRERDVKKCKTGKTKNYKISSKKDAELSKRIICTAQHPTIVMSLN